MSLVGLTALVLLAAHAPPRIRLLGLFAVLIGGVSAWGLAYAAERLKFVDPRKSTIVTVAILLTATQVGLTLESWRIEINRKYQEYFVETRKEVPAMVWEQMEADLRVIYERETTFPAYLHTRLLQLKKQTGTEEDWSDAGVMTFWLAELSLGVAAGMFVFRKSVGSAAQQNTAGSA